jgi:hypothetical protein
LDCFIVISIFKRSLQEEVVEEVAAVEDGVAEEEEEVGVEVEEEEEVGVAEEEEEVGVGAEDITQEDPRFITQLTTKIMIHQMYIFIRCKLLQMMFPIQIVSAIIYGGCLDTKS